MAKHIVGTVAEIPPGARKIVEIGGRTIGIFNVNGEFFAVRNTCPHQGGPLCAGAQTGLREAPVPGEYTYTRLGEILRCPWHGWEFDIRTGQSWWNPDQVRTRAYKVSVEEGPQADMPCGASGPQPGPYTAETYPVAVEQRFVVVEVP
ncbi:MAG: Rieske 2Fe-2S domain-containing protein [Litorilinea sp.]